VDESQRLKAAPDQWTRAAGAARIEIPARKAHKKSSVALVFRNGGEIEVQANTWIWVSGDELKTAFQRLGVVAPW
jgi:hypothetical protein